MAQPPPYQQLPHQHQQPYQQPTHQQPAHHQPFATARQATAGPSSDALVPTSVLPASLRRLFPYAKFNRMQSACFDAAYSSDASLVVASPTGSGKTAVLELALARLFGNGHSRGADRPLAVYMAPLKALTHERLTDWKPKLAALNVVELTGDSDDVSDERAVGQADLVLTTPEKWDQFSRFRRDAQSAIGRVALLLVDEVHMLGDKDRGSTLEAVITRLRTIAQGADVAGMPIAKLRVFAASATISNVEDIAEWLGHGTVIKRFDESYRPVPLTWRVLTYPMAKPFTFDKFLSQKVYGVVRDHASGRPALVFCNSRKICKEAAAQVARDAGAALVRGADQQRLLMQAANGLGDKALASLVRAGVAYHDASLEVGDKRAIEALFADGALMVLCCTSGLAQGVNLPARLVVLMNTMKYTSNSGGYEEYTRIETMQMAGRAGRPQFDDEGVCVVMARDEMRARYEHMLGGTETIESHMHENQLPLINAEIASAGTYMSDISVCVRWLKSTFLATRMAKNPQHYKLQAGQSAAAIESHLKQLLMRNLQRLASAGMIALADDGLGVRPLLLGTVMARFCVDFDTTCAFARDVDGRTDLEGIVNLLAHANEFREPLYLRHNEKKALFTVNSSNDIRFPIMDGKKRSKVKTAAMKASLLLQLRAGGHSLGDFRSAEYTLLQSGGRILNALVDYLTREEKHCPALKAALLLRRALTGGLGWHDDALAGVRQLDGIGPTYAHKLHESHAGSLETLSQQMPARIELLCGKGAPFGSQVLRHARALLASAPSLRAEAQSGTSNASQPLGVSIQLLRSHGGDGGAGGAGGSAGAPPPQRGRQYGHPWVLLVGDSHGRLLLIRRLTQGQLDAAPEVSFQLSVTPQSTGVMLHVHLVHMTLHGLDRTLAVRVPHGDATPSATASSGVVSPTASTSRPPRAAATPARKAHASPPSAGGTQRTLPVSFTSSTPGKVSPPLPPRGFSALATNIVGTSAAAQPSARNSINLLDLAASSDDEQDAPMAEAQAEPHGTAAMPMGVAPMGTTHVDAALEGDEDEDAAFVDGESAWWEESAGWETTADDGTSTWHDDNLLFGEEPPPSHSSPPPRPLVPPSAGMSVSAPKRQRAESGPSDEAARQSKVQAAPRGTPHAPHAPHAPPPAASLLAAAGNCMGVGGASSGACDDDAFWAQFRATSESARRLSSGTPAHKGGGGASQHNGSGKSRGSGGGVGAHAAGPPEFLTSRRIEPTDASSTGVEAATPPRGRTHRPGGRAAGTGGGLGGGGGGSSSGGLVEQIKSRMSAVPPTPARRMPIDPLPMRLQPSQSTPSAALSSALSSAPLRGRPASAAAAPSRVATAGGALHPSTSAFLSAPAAPRISQRPPPPHELPLAPLPPPAMHGPSEDFLMGLDFPSPAQTPSSRKPPSAPPMPVPPSSRRSVPSFDAGNALARAPPVGAAASGQNAFDLYAPLGAPSHHRPSPCAASSYVPAGRPPASGASPHAIPPPGLPPAALMRDVVRAPGAFDAPRRAPSLNTPLGSSLGASLGPLAAARPPRWDAPAATHTRSVLGELAQSKMQPARVHSAPPMHSAPPTLAGSYDWQLGSTLSEPQPPSRPKAPSAPLTACSFRLGQHAAQGAIGSVADGTRGARDAGGEDGRRLNSSVERWLTSLAPSQPASQPGELKKRGLQPLVVTHERKVGGKAKEEPSSRSMVNLFGQR